MLRAKSLLIQDFLAKNYGAHCIRNLYYDIINILDDIEQSVAIINGKMPKLYVLHAFFKQGLVVVALIATLMQHIGNNIGADIYAI